MTVQCIGILATRAADLGLLRGHIDAMCVALPAEAEWQFRYFRSLTRFTKALAGRRLAIGVLLHMDLHEPPPLLPADGSVIIIRPMPDSAAPATSGEMALHSLNPTALQYALRSALQRRDLADEVRYLEQNDAVTGLPLGGALLAHIDAALDTNAQADNDLTRPHLFCIALAGFADLQDTLGIATAERLLKLTAQRLAHRIKRGEQLACGSGAEFLVWTRYATSDAVARRRAGTFAAALAPPFELTETVAYMTTAIGIAPAAADLRADELLQQARSAADAAAMARGDGIALFAGPSPRMSRRRQVIEALGYAIERNEFEVFYQPIVDLRSGAIAGAEALLRWHGQSVGEVSPGHFIPIAEESGAILSIGEWVLQHACRAAVTWLDRFWQPVRLSVNVSAQQFGTRRLQEQLLRVLSEMPLTADQVELEISERSYLAMMRTQRREFEALRDIGFRIVIDDFGSSYASLSYLKQFPVDALKIDRSFIAPLPGSARDAALVTAFIAMGRSLGLRVVGVGVETEAQLEFLRAAGCDEAQGFYLSHPVPGDEFIGLLLRNPPVVAPLGTAPRARSS